MNKAQDLTGEKFGNLTVLERAENINGRTAWLCKCECGIKKIIKTKYLKSGDTKSCGCLKLKNLKNRNRYNNPSKKINLKGEKFGDLTVIEKSENINGYTAWLCKCECGNEKVIRSNALRSGYTKSCGCLKSKIKHKFTGRKRTKNIYIIKNDYAILISSNTKREIYIDNEDIEKICSYTWLESEQGYIHTHVTEDGKQKRMMLHRLLMDVEKEDWRKIQVDHRNRNTLDNRKINLRICSGSENQINRLPRKNNTSGVTGVIFEKRENKWRADIHVDKQRIYLGSFKDKDKAIEARKEAERKYYQGFSPNENV